MQIVVFPAELLSAARTILGISSILIVSALLSISFHSLLFLSSYHHAFLFYIQKEWRIVFLKQFSGIALTEQSSFSLRRISKSKSFKD